MTARIRDWKELTFDIRFSGQETTQSPLALDDRLRADLASAGITLSSSSNLNVLATVGGGLELGLDLSNAISLTSNASLDGVGFLRVSPITFGVSIDAQNIQSTVGLDAAVFGTAASIQVNDGQVRINAQASLALAPSEVDGTGRFRLPVTLRVPDLEFQADGKLDASFPLSVTLGSFDLSNYGIPTLLLNTDALLDIKNGEALVTTPSVSLDVQLSKSLIDSLLNGLGQLREVGERIPFGLFDRPLPGLGQSLNELLTNSESTLGQGGLGGVFRLKEAAGHYLYADYNSLSGTGASINPSATVRGLLDSLNKAFASLTQIRFDADRIDWSGVNLSGFDFSGYRNSGGRSLAANYLRGLNFRGSDLRGANFTGLDLTGVDFSGARFDASTNFTGAILRRVRFSDADLRGVNLSGLDLRWADFSRSRVDNLDVRNSAAFDVSFANIRFSTNGIPNLGNLVTNLNLSDWFGPSSSSGWRKLQYGLDLSGSSSKSWARFDLSGLDFSGVNLSEFDLQGVNLRNTILSNANLSNTNLSNAFAWFTSWKNAQLTGAVYSGLVSNVELSAFGSGIKWLSPQSNAKDTDFINFDFSGWDLSSIDFTGVSISGANFSGAKLQGAKLGTFSTNLDFSFADLSGIDFSGISTIAGNFRGSILSGLDFTGVSWNVPSLDFTRVDFSGSSKFEGLFSNLSGDVQAKFDHAMFQGVDFST
ncbi:MAG: pentapeptide repeat-containing protein, partial [Pirellula sp.]